MVKEHYLKIVFKCIQYNSRRDALIGEASVPSALQYSASRAPARPGRSNGTHVDRTRSAPNARLRTWVRNALYGDTSAPPQNWSLPRPQKAIKTRSLIHISHPLQVP